MWNNYLPHSSLFNVNWFWAFIETYKTVWAFHELWNTDTTHWVYRGAEHWNALLIPWILAEASTFSQEAEGLCAFLIFCGRECSLCYYWHYSCRERVFLSDAHSAMEYISFWHVLTSLLISVLPVDFPFFHTKQDFLNTELNSCTLLLYYFLLWLHSQIDSCWMSVLVYKIHIQKEWIWKCWMSREVFWCWVYWGLMEINVF